MINLKRAAVKTGLIAFFLTGASAVAAPFVPQTPIQNSVVDVPTNVKWICRANRHCWEQPDRPNTFGFYFGANGFRFGPRERRADFYDENRSVSPSSSHIEWCLDHYKSYNPRTDLYLAYSGKYRHCRSPYR